MTSPSQIDAFWARANRSLGRSGDRPLPRAESFGDSPELADELLDLVLHGPKRATAAALVDYEDEGAPVDQVGDEWISLDGAGHPRAVLRVTDVRIGALSSVDDTFAWDEGEGDRTPASWLADHERFFRRTFAEAGRAFSPDLATVFVRFEVIYTED